MRNQEVIIMKTNKICALVMAGVLACSAPVYADTTTETILSESGIMSIISDPDELVDVVVYVKDAISNNEVSDSEILNLIDEAAEKFDISMSDSEKESILTIVKQVKNLDFDEDNLRSEVKDAYQKLKDLGIGKEQVKGILEICIDFVKNIF
jgi:uncharacterized protein YpuA (DUF1002 family)